MGGGVVVNIQGGRVAKCHPRPPTFPPAPRTRPKLSKHPSGEINTRSLRDARGQGWGSPRSEQCLEGGAAMFGGFGGEVLDGYSHSFGVVWVGLFRDLLFVGCFCMFVYIKLSRSLWLLVVIWHDEVGLRRKRSTSFCTRLPEMREPARPLKTLDNLSAQCCRWRGSPYTPPLRSRF